QCAAIMIRQMAARHTPEVPMKPWLTLLPAVACALSIMPQLLAADEGEDAKLAAFFKSYLDEAFRAEPMMATHLGDHRFDDRLDDISPTARAANLERERQVLAELPRKISYDKLSRDGQIDFEILRHHLTRSIWLQEHFKPFE